MGKIIFLNGCGSSGKTSIAQAIQHLSDDLWLTYGVDTFIAMTPSNKHAPYFKFIPGQNERGPLMRVDVGLKGKKLFGIMPKFAEMLASCGHNVIIDEVLLNEESLKAYAESLKHHVTYYIGVFCDLEIMQQREILRRDRYIGLSNDQIDRVHQDSLNFYDFKINTSSMTPFEAARLVLKFIYDTPNPKAFKKLLPKE